MNTENKASHAIYQLDGIRYEVNREFSEAVPLRELLKQELADAIHRNPPVDQAANL